MPKVRLQQQAFSIRASASSEDTRTETFMGREYVVVPVVALVEGVLQGMNAANPELALFEEFGSVPDGWNGRPVVMNHPIVDGSPVSANSPTVLETYQLGYVFHALGDGEAKKLIVEAWLDVERIKALGGEAQSTLDRVLAGTIVEVSTGLFTGLEETKGRFNNQDYSGIWRNIIPDHLAFLSEGTIGACSIEDGCGTPRNNAAQQSNLKVNQTAIRWQDCGCKHGGTQMPGKTPATQEGQHETQTETVQTPTENTETVIITNKAGEPVSFNADRFLANAYPNNMLDGDARKLVATALAKLMGRNNYAYVIGLTNDYVVYETWDYLGDGYMTFRRSYSVAEDKSVSLGDTAEQVVVTMEITPFKTATSADNGTTTNFPLVNGAPEMPESNTGQQQTQQPSPTGQATTVAPTTPAAETTVAPTTNAAPTPAVNAAPARVTLDEYIAQAPRELQGALRGMMESEKVKRTNLIKTIKDSGRNKFSDAQLEAMESSVLEQLVDLAGVNTPRANYSGTATGEHTLNDNSGFAPEPPPLIPPKSAVA